VPGLAARAASVTAPPHWTGEEGAERRRRVECLAPSLDLAAPRLVLTGRGQKVREGIPRFFVGTLLVPVRLPFGETVGRSRIDLDLVFTPAFSNSRESAATSSMVTEVSPAPCAMKIGGVSEG
jgi:hypothetical protein